MLKTQNIDEYNSCNYYFISFVYYFFTILFKRHFYIAIQLIREVP